MSRRGWVLFAAMCVIWGLPYLLIRVAVRDLSPSTVVFARTAIGTVLLVPLVVRRRMFGALRGRIGWLLLYTVVEVALPWWLLTDAEQHLTSSLSGLLVAAVPLVGVVLNRLAGGDPVDSRRLGGLLVGLAGVIALVGLQVGQIDMTAVLEVMVVAVGYAAGPLILSRRLATVPGLAVVAASLGLTALGYLPLAATHLPHHVRGHVIVAVIVLAVVCTALAFLVFVALIAEVGPTRATVITYVNPAVAILLGVTILGEHFTTGMAVGFPLVLLGSVLATAPSPSRLREPVPSG